MVDFLSYLRYIAATSSNKTKKLVTLAQEDTFYAELVALLNNYGYQIAHRFFGHSGAYLPDSIELLEGSLPEEELKTLYAQGELKAHFSFSSRYGYAQNAHYFLHELMHFWQDIHGLCLTPLIEKQRAPIMLDMRSHIALTCFCEAMAETEALRGSWRLKQAGHPVAWQGALASFDWRSHAQAYATDLDAMTETEAARCAFERWYQSRQKPYYEKRALQSYQAFTKAQPNNSATTLTPMLRRIDLDRLVETLPASSQWGYLSLQSLNDTLYHSIRHQRIARQVQAFEKHYGECSNPNVTDIRIGTAPYLWDRLLNQNSFAISGTH